MIGKREDMVGLQLDSGQRRGLLRLLLPYEREPSLEARLTGYAIGALLLVKLVLAVCICTGDTAAIYRVTTFWLECGLRNPWDYIAAIDPAAAQFQPPPFPYPPFMLVVLGAARTCTYVLGFTSDTFTPLAGLSFKLVPYLCDIATGTLLFHIARRAGQSNQTGRRALLLWHASLVLLYGMYLQGQFDIIPTCLTVLAIYLLLGNRPLTAACVLALSVACKHYSLVLFCPLMIWILKDTSRSIPVRLATVAGCGIILALVLVPLYAPFVTSHEFETKVLDNPEGQRVWIPTYAVVEGALWIYLCPFIVAVIALLAWAARHRAVNLIATCFALLVIFTTIVAPMPGWYVWNLPFAVLLAAMVPGGMLIVSCYGLAYFAYFCLFESTVLRQLCTWYSWQWPLRETPFAVISREHSVVKALRICNTCFTLLVAGQVALLAAWLRTSPASSEGDAAVEPHAGRSFKRPNDGRWALVILAGVLVIAGVLWWRTSSRPSLQMAELEWTDQQPPRGTLCYECDGYSRRVRLDWQCSTARRLELVRVPRSGQGPGGDEVYCRPLRNEQLTLSGFKLEGGWTIWHQDRLYVPTARVQAEIPATARFEATGKFGLTDLDFVKHPAGGIVRITVDGHAPQTLDLYAPQDAWERVRLAGSSVRMAVPLNAQHVRWSLDGEADSRPASLTPMGD